MVLPRVTERVTVYEDPARSRPGAWFKFIIIAFPSMPIGNAVLSANLSSPSASPGPSMVHLIASSQVGVWIDLTRIVSFPKLTFELPSVLRGGSSAVVKICKP